MSTRVIEASLGTQTVRVMSVVPQRYWPPVSSRMQASRTSGAVLASGS